MFFCFSFLLLVSVHPSPPLSLSFPLSFSLSVSLSLSFSLSLCYGRLSTRVEDSKHPINLSCLSSSASVCLSVCLFICLSLSLSPNLDLTKILKLLHLFFTAIKFAKIGFQQFYGKRYQVGPHDETPVWASLTKIPPAIRCLSVSPLSLSLSLSLSVRLPLSLSFSVLLCLQEVSLSIIHTPKTFTGSKFVTTKFEPFSEIP